MNIFVSVLCYDRPDVLRRSIATIMENASKHDAEVLAINDGSDGEVARILRLTRVCARENYSIPFYTLSKSRSMGMVHSCKIALAYARMFCPKYWFIAEGDYIFQLDCYKTVLDVFENTPEGRMCLGIVGYDDKIGRDSLGTIRYEHEGRIILLQSKGEKLSVKEITGKEDEE